MKKYRIQKFIMSNGKPMLREVDITTNKKRLVNLPMTSDVDVVVASYKYPGKTLGELIKIDPDYVKWIVTNSQASDRIKKGAARIMAGKPYFVPEEGSIISEDMLYDPADGAGLIKQICQKESQYS